MSILGRDIFYRCPPGAVVASLNIEVRLDDGALSAEDRALGEGMRSAVLRDQARETMFRFLYDEILVEVLALENQINSHFGGSEKVPPAIASFLMRTQRLLEGSEITGARSMPPNVEFRRHPENRFVGVDPAAEIQRGREELLRDGWLTPEDMEAIRRRSEPPPPQTPPATTPPAAGAQPPPPWVSTARDSERRERLLRSVRTSAEALAAERRLAQAAAEAEIQRELDAIQPASVREAMMRRVATESPFAGIVVPPNTLPPSEQPLSREEEAQFLRRVVANRPVVAPAYMPPIPETVAGVEPVAETRPRAIVRTVETPEESPVQASRPVPPTMAVTGTLRVRRRRTPPRVNEAPY